MVMMTAVVATAATMMITTTLAMAAETDPCDGAGVVELEISESGHNSENVSCGNGCIC